MFSPSWCFCFALLALFLLVSAEKERVSDQSLDQLTSKLWHEIEKRLQEDEGMLGDGGPNVLSQFGEGASDDSCRYDTLNGTIVRTHDSQARGAKFLNSIDSNTDADLDIESCLQSCCDDDKCNLAVFKNKKPDHSCYLFDCGSPSVCLFTEHPGFSTHSLPKRRNGNKEQEKHADELENLAAVTTTTTTTTTTTEATTTSTTTTQQPTLPPKKVKVPVALFGDCESHQDCAGSNTECLAGYCLCQKGFHAQDAMCRKDCTRFEFECANEGQPSAYPQCIAIYDKCDGSVHCKDGSDELNCPPSQTQGFAYGSAPQSQPIALPPRPAQQPVQPLPPAPSQPQAFPVDPQQHVPQAQDGYQDPNDFQSQSYADQLWNYGGHSGEKASPVNVPVQPQQPQQAYPQKAVPPPPRMQRPVPSPAATVEVRTLTPHVAKPPPQHVEAPQSSFNTPSVHSVRRKPGPRKPAFTQQKQEPELQASPKKVLLPQTDTYVPSSKVLDAPMPQNNRNRGQYTNYGVSDGGRVGTDGRYNNMQGAGSNAGGRGGYKLGNMDAGYGADAAGGGRGYGYGYGNRFGNPDYRYYDTGGQGMWNNGPNLDYDYYNVDPGAKPEPSDLTNTKEDALTSDAPNAGSPITPSSAPPREQVPYYKTRPPVIPQVPGKEFEEAPVVLPSKPEEKEKETDPEIDSGGIAALNPLEKNKPEDEIEVLTEKPDVIEEHEENPAQNANVVVVKKTQKENGNAVVAAISSEGAVIALALGLAITAVLLVFVGCRLRYMKHRLRKGRPLNSNEADYLINGMYL